MKRSIIYVLLATVTIFSCRKSDNAKLPVLIRVPTPLVTKDATADQVITAQDPSKFSGKVIVDLFFKSDAPPQKMDAIIIKNGNKATAKVLQADITAFPTTVPITGPQLVTLFGSPVVLGDKFEIGVDVTTQSGQKYLAYPTDGGNAYASSIGNQVGASLTATFQAVCPYVASAFVGNFEVISDEWNDYKPGTIIPVKAAGTNQISFEYAVDPGTAKPIILKIDPATYAVSVAAQEYGSYGGDKYSAESVAGTSSAINPCDVSISVQLIHSSGGATTSPYTIKLKKKL